MPTRRKKRAIALAGGGPAAGFHIGALWELEQWGITFDVWSLSCICAWVGIYYNQIPDAEVPGHRPGRATRTYEFFETHAFRDTASYRGFPVNKAFAPHYSAYAKAWLEHSKDPATWWNLFAVCNELPDVAAAWTRCLLQPQSLMREGDFNTFVLNNILAVHPVSRYLTSLMYLSPINGLSNIYYPDSTFLQHIGTNRLDLLGKDLDQSSHGELQALADRYDEATAPRQQHVPEIYHNAWRTPDERRGLPGRLQLFNNKWARYWKGKDRRDYLPITRPSLCACSALPYIEQTVQIPNDGHHDYSEGALVDTVSFRQLVEDHPDLDEIWVCRIVDYRQVRRPHDLHDSLGNLCEQFAAEVGENDVELFKTHLRKSVGRTPRVVEIPLQVRTKINYRWDRENLRIGFDEGAKAVRKVMQDAELRRHDTTNPAWPRK